MPRRESDSIKVTLEDGTRLTLRRILSGLPEALRGPRAAEALDSVSTLAERLYLDGTPNAALRVVSAIRTSMPQPIDHARDAWLLNTEGLALSTLGRDDDASRRFESMLSIGTSTADQSIEATALQNLASLALKASRYDEARKLGAQSYALKRRLGDHYGAAQVLINMATADIEEKEWKRARRLLNALAQDLRHWKIWGLLASVEMLRARIAVAHRFWTEAEERYRSALGLTRRVGELEKELVILLNLGHVKLDQGDPSGSLRWLRNARRVAGRLELPVREQEIGELVASALHRAGRDLDFADELRRTRRIATRNADKHGWARMTADLGAVSLNLGRLDSASRYLGAAQTAFQEIGDASWESRVTRNRAALARAQGRLDEARKLLERSFSLAPEEDHEARADIKRYLAETWVLSRDTAEQATPYFWQEISEAARGGTRASVPWRALTAAALLAQVGAHEDSLEFYAFAARGYSRLRQRQWVFHARNDRAIALTELGRYADARRAFSLCLKMAAELSDRAMEQRARTNLGELSRRQGRLQEAMTHSSRAVSLAHELEDSQEESEAWANLGIVLKDLRRFDESARAFQSSLTKASKGVRGAKAIALGGLGGLAVAQGDHRKAITLYRRAAALNQSRDDRHLIEDLAGLLEATAMVGRRKAVDAEAQRLVDEAQRLREEPTAVFGMCRAGRQLLRRGETDQAAELFAGAMALAGAGYSRQSGWTIEGLAQAMMEPLFIAAIHVGDEMPEGQDVVMPAIRELLKTEYKLRGPAVDEMFDVASSMVRQRGIGDRTRS